MFKILILVLSLISLTALASINQWQTPEGAKVLFTQTKGLPIVDIALTFDAASSRDGKQLGIGSLTNEMIGTGSKKYNQTQIIEGFSALGAEFSHMALKDMSIISLRTLSYPDILKPSLALFSHIISQPIFTQKVLTRLKKQTLQGIKSKQDNPAILAKEAFEASIFSNHAYAHPSIGNATSINALTIKAITAHYKQYFVAKNLTIAIVADISKAHAKNIARQISHGLNVGQKPKSLTKIKLAIQSFTQHIDHHSTQSHLYLGRAGINRNHPNYYALYLGNHIFGGSALNSILGQLVREKNGLAYSVYSYFQPMAANGFFTINLQTKNSQLEKAKKLSFQALNNFIQSGITDQRIADAKNNIIGLFALNTANNKQILNYLSLIGFYNLPLTYLEDFPEKIKQLNTQKVQLAMQNFFKIPIWTTITAGGKL